MIIGCATLFPIEHVTPAFSELIWFCFLYLFIGLYKRYQFFKYQWFEKYSLLWFIVGYLFLCGIRVLANYLNHEGLYRIFIHYYAHYEALLGFICSLALFFIFKNWNIRPNRFVNLVSRSTFAVYIIHQTPAFYNYMWNGIFRIDPAVESGNGIVYSLFVIAAIFVVSVCVDNVRIFVMDRSIYKCKVYRLVCKRLEEFYQ